MSEELNDQPELEVTDAPEPAEVEIPIDDDPPETEDKTSEPDKKTFNPKKDKVEFSTPEQEARFNEIFRQLKKSDQRNEMLTDFLQEQGKLIDDIRQERSQVAQADAEKVILERIKIAREQENFDEYDKAFRELTKYESSKLFEEKVNEFRKSETVQADNDARFVAKAMEETDENGNYIRPWLQEQNDQFPVALYQIKKIAGKYQGDPQILEKTLKELDEVMSAPMKKDPPKPQVRAPNPMQGSNLTNHNPKGKIKMSRVEADILSKLERHSGKKIDLKKYDARRTAMYEGKSKGGR